MKCNYIFLWNWKNADEPDDVFSQGVSMPSLFLRGLFKLDCSTPLCLDQINHAKHRWHWTNTLRWPVQKISHFVWTDAWGYVGVGGALWGHQKKSAMWFLFPYTLSKLKASHWIWRLTGFCKIHVLAYFHHIVKVGLDEKKLIQMWNCSSLIAVTIFMCINISNNICWIFILYLYITARAAI